MRNQSTRPSIIPTTGLVVLLLAGVLGVQSAQAQPHRPGYIGSSFRVQLGEFQPDADSTYWDDVARDFTGSPGGFEDTSFGVAYLHPLGERLSLHVAGSFYEGIESQAYIAFEDQFGGDILHTTELEIASLTVGLLYKLTGRDAAIVPYVGAGGGVYSWRLTEFGDFIDFDTAGLEIFNDFFQQEDEDLGYYFLAGVDVPLAETWSIFAEARWDDAEGELAGDFRGLGDLDLSGRSYSAGLSWRF